MLRPYGGGLLAEAGFQDHTALDLPANDGVAGCAGVPGHPQGTPLRGWWVGGRMGWEWGVKPFGVWVV